MRDLIAATSLVILLKLDSNHQFFSPCDLEVWYMTSKKYRTPLPYYLKLCASFQVHRWIQIEFAVWKRPMRFKIADLEIWWITLKNNRAPLLCCFKLCASFHSHHWIQTGVTVRKCPIWVKISAFLYPVTLKLHGWPWKTKGHLFDTALSNVPSSEFKLELQPRNAQFRSNLVICCPLPPWNLMDDLEKQKGTSSILSWAIGEFKLELQSETPNSGQNLRIFLSPVTLKFDRWPGKNKAPLICCFKLYVSFHSHYWTQTGVTIWKHIIWVKIHNFVSRVILKFDRWPWKMIGHLS